MNYDETLVIIRAIDEQGATKYDFYLSNAPRDTPAKEFARVALAAHRVEECIQRAKSEAGLSHYEVRNWRGWHHHQTLSLIASWFLTREALRGKKMGAGNHRAADPRWHRDDPANRPPVRHANQNREQQDTPLGPKRGSPFLSLQST